MCENTVEVPVVINDISKNINGFIRKKLMKSCFAEEKRMMKHNN